MSSASLIKTPPEKVRVNGWVFYTSTALILLLTAILIVAPQEAGRLLGVAQAWLSKSFGWYYMVVIAAYLVFVVGLAFSSYGKLKLGAKDDTPDFSYGAWAGMLFSSGIGISLLYFGASEPLDHYFNPPEGAAASNGAARQALQLTFLHWGLHGWAIYALVGLAVAYFAYRHNQPLALRSALYPLVGERWVKGAAGHAVDGFGMFVTLLGLVTNLGIGSMQVSSGLENLFGMEHSNTNLLIVIIVMSTVATIAAVSGVENGIRRLSNLNIVLFSGLLIFVLLFGPTLHLLNGLVQNTGDYLNGIVLKTFDLYVYEGDGAKTERWMGLWTLFYWAWWISWAPFVGMFIARISRGRTVRELVAGVLLIPLGFTLAWLSIFGNSALDLVLNHGAVELGKTALEQPSMAIYQLLEHYPASKVVIGVSIFVGFVLFLTPADSGAVMMANLSCKGGNVDEDAPLWLRIFWSADDYVRTFVAHTNPLNVLCGRSLMRTLDNCTRVNGSVCLDPGGDSWLDLAEGNTIQGARQNGVTMNLQNWAPGQAVEGLGRVPTLVDSNIGMRDALQIRYQTGNKLVLHDNNKVVGILGDSELYHALLGKNLG